MSAQQEAHEAEQAYTRLCTLQAAETDKIGKNLLLALVTKSAKKNEDELEKEKATAAADRQRRYASLCKQQVSYIAAQIEKNPQYHELSQIMDAAHTSNNNKRKRQYTCHLCGQPKKGHVCSKIKKEETKSIKTKDSEDDGDYEYGSSDDNEFSVVTRSGRKTKRSTRRGMQFFMLLSHP